MSHSHPPIPVDLFLTVAFVLMCRWIRRNPSSFLRYALFPIGGLNVERWPRFMLGIVRVCAALGFFALLLTFINLLAPDSVATPTPTVLFTKYALCLLASFFALRGTAEPVVSYERPEFGTPSAQPPTIPKTEPAVPRSVSAMSKTVPVPALAIPRVGPAIPKNVPTIPPASPKPPPAAFGPKARSGQSHLSEVEATPVPNRSFPLSAPPPSVVRERLVTIASKFVMEAIIVGFFYLLGITWLVMAFLIFFSFAELVTLLGRNAAVGTCPFCGGLIQLYNRLRPEPLRCEYCSEISKFENERLRPHDPDAVSEKAIFRSFAYENGVWPNGCVQCSAPPTRFDYAKAVRYQARRLATPLASALIAPPPRGEGHGSSLLRSSSRRHSSHPSQRDVCLDSLEIFARV